MSKTLMPMLATHRLVPLLLLALTAPGCGDGLAVVSGKITYNGEPVSRGMLSLEPADGIGPTHGCNVEGGQYEVADVLPGEKLIRISAVHVVGTEKRYPEDPASTDVIEITEDLLPPEFNNMSTLTLTVEAPETEKDFELTGVQPGKAKPK